MIHALGSDVQEFDNELNRPRMQGCKNKQAKKQKQKKRKTQKEGKWRMGSKFRKYMVFLVLSLL